MDINKNNNIADMKQRAFGIAMKLFSRVSTGVLMLSTSAFIVSCGGGNGANSLDSSVDNGNTGGSLNSVASDTDISIASMLIAVEESQEQQLESLLRPSDHLPEIFGPHEALLEIYGEEVGVTGTALPEEPELLAALPNLPSEVSNEESISAESNISNSTIASEVEFPFGQSQIDGVPYCFHDDIDLSGTGWRNLVEYGYNDDPCIVVASNADNTQGNPDIGYTPSLEEALVANNIEHFGDPLFLEVDTGDINGFQLVESLDASNGSFITVPRDSDEETYGALIEWNFEVTRAGLYRILAGARGRGGNANSFWVQINDGADWLWHVFNSDRFTEQEVTHENSGTALAYLLQGSNKITVRLRETGTELDWIKPDFIKEDKDGDLDLDGIPNSVDAFPNISDTTMLGAASAPEDPVISIVSSEVGVQNEVSTGLDYVIELHSASGDVQRLLDVQEDIRLRDNECS